RRHALVAGKPARDDGYLRTLEKIVDVTLLLADNLQLCSEALEQPPVSLIEAANDHGHPGLRDQAQARLASEIGEFGWVGSTHGDEDTCRLVLRSSLLRERSRSYHQQVPAVQTSPRAARRLFYDLSRLVERRCQAGVFERRRATVDAVAAKGRQ